ncbi:glycosyltransferase [Sphingomonas sp. RP10(2022)]|uniref:Glycosyltransferase n=1 Tax=Sphingomonas liriopis TaxID=2949094 RepID=A0A9X2HZ03_9SPHN|nr:glycosyltransferase [Sphingomonas liriopis]
MFEAIVAQAQMLADADAEPIVFALHDEYCDADRHRFGTISVHTGHVVGPRQVGWSPDLGRMLAAADLDLLHLHGVWTATSHLGAAWARRTDKPYVISPHGMLDPWITGRGRTKKWIARRLYERRSWARATMFHALTDAEAADIARETGRDAVTVIPNPVDFDAAPAPAASGPQPIVYLGRIHSKKNIDSLIDGWRLLVDRRGMATPPLTIAGWGDDHDVAALGARIAAVGDARLSFVGPVYGADKQRLIAGAVALALPSHSEGLPMVILESWAAGVPTAMSTHCHLSEGFGAGAAVDSGTEPGTIAAALSTLIDEDATARAARSAAARRLVAERFVVPVIRTAWFSAYRRLIERRI